MSSDLTDLDALVPQPRQIKFNNEIINIQPPKTADVLRLGQLGQKLQNTDTVTPEGLDTLVTEITALVYKCVPELQSAALQTPQLLSLIGIISEMATPPENKELERRGLTPTDTSPKASPSS